MENEMLSSAFEHHSFDMLFFTLDMMKYLLQSKQKINEFVVTRPANL
jgi:hypothetical protein